MKILLTTAFLLALGLGQHASAQGPVRGTLRGVGEAAVQGTRGVVDAAADTTRAAGQATLNAGERTAVVARNIAGATAQGVRNGAAAITPNIPAEARLNADGPVDRNARWRFARHNGEWWYYTPQNAWMYHRNNDWNTFSEDKFQPMSQPHTVGYRGQNTATDQLSASQPVRIDRYGREFICDNGRPMYLNETQDDHQAWNGQGKPDYAPSRPAEAGVETPETSAQDQTATPEATATPEGSAPPAATVTPEVNDAAENSGSPQSSREINNNPNPAPEGQPGTTGVPNSDNN